jgi:hypothetical protein
LSTNHDAEAGHVTTVHSTNESAEAGHVTSVQYGENSPSSNKRPGSLAKKIKSAPIILWQNV